MTIHKQLTIKKAFKRARTLQSDDTEELREEIQQLELQLKDKQNELFELQKETYRREIPLDKRKSSKALESFAQIETVIATNEVQNLKDVLSLISMVTGLEVKSFEENEECSVVFHMQHSSENVIKHGLTIDLRNGRQQISEYSFPLGFNLSSVMEEYDSVMMPKCLYAIRNALIAYYDRLGQYEQLRKSIFLNAQLIKILDASYVEIEFSVYDERDPDEDTIDLALVLQYRLHDVRPKKINFRYIGGPEHVEEIMLQQCAIFKRKALLKAFNKAFVNGAGPYKLAVKALKSAERRPRRHRRPKPHRAANCNNDDTFHPDECSDSEYDEEE